MFHYVWLMLRRQHGRNVLTGSGFLLAACALILLSATTQTTDLQAKQIISQNWRSTYDLVVLPPQTAIPSSTTIPPDQFEGYDGGISIQQYRQIKTLPNIAVAAPIAFVGYVLFPTVTLNFGPHGLSPGFYKLHWTLTAFNGFEYITEYDATTFVYGSDAPCPAGACGLSNDQEQILNEIGVSDYFFTRNGPYAYYTGVPNLGTFLLAAIDPVAENQLAHLDASIVQGDSLPEQTQFLLRPDQPYVTGDAGEKVPNYEVPLLLNTHLPGQLTLQASLVHLLTPITDPQQVLMHGGRDYLDQLSQQTIFNGDVPMAQNNLQLLGGGENLQQQGYSDMQIQYNGYPYFPLNFVSGPAPLTYHTATAPKDARGIAYTLIPNPDQTPGKAEVAFRKIKPLPGTLRQFMGTYGYSYEAVDQTFYNGVSYTAEPVGEFDGQRLSATFTNVLNWLPENTYTSFPTVRRYDAQGRPVKPTMMLSTTNPSGYLMESPLALTTLAAAQQIRGNDCISVIRIRIAGNLTPDEAGWKRASQVAQEIHQRTGLRAIVTLGASPQPTLVFIPGVKAGQYVGATQTIDPVGWVEERWIAIGVALVYLNQLTQTQIFLLGAVLLVCLGYLAVMMSFLVSTQRREIAVLSALGWRPWHSIGMVIAQALTLALSGGIMGTGLALLIVFLIGSSLAWSIVFSALPTVLGLALLSTLYPLWTVWCLQPAEVLRARTKVVGMRTISRWEASLWSRLPTLGTMAWRNLSRSAVRVGIALGSLFLSTILLTVIVDSLLVIHKTLQGTLLGNYILVQTAVPQMAGVVFAVLLTFLNLADLLMLQVRERQQEIGLLQAVGWRVQMVQRLFVQEGLMLAVLGAALGGLVASGILVTRHETQGIVPVPLIAIGVVVFMLVVAVLATVPALRAINRLPPLDTLRAE